MKYGKYFFEILALVEQMVKKNDIEIEKMKSCFMTMQKDKDDSYI